MRTIIFLSLFAFSLYAQNVTVVKIEKISNPETGHYYHPSVSPNGKVLVTGNNFEGLYLLENRTVKTITTQPGAGYEPAFSANSNYVYFRADNYKKRLRQTSLIKKSLIDNKEQILIKDERDFTSPRRLKNGAIAVNRQTSFYKADAMQEKKEDAPALFLEKGKIALYQNGNKTILTPKGEGFYIWASLSPQQDKILFTKPGKGTFISNLKGEVIAELGYANAPKWSPDGKWVVYMKDLDDGHRMLESDIYVCDALGKKHYKITDSAEEIELYPAWGILDEIVFGSEAGIIYKAHINIE